VAAGALVPVFICIRATNTRPALKARSSVERKGSDAKNHTAGQSYHNEPGVVHEANNKGSVPAKTFNVFVVEKGTPVTQPVKR
jgi:hypothetical protein